MVSKSRTSAVGAFDIMNKGPARQRTCKRCKRLLGLDDFHRDKSLRDGRRYICKRCACQATKASHQRLNIKTCGLYGVLHSMKQRCYSRSHKSYPRYGGRGIRICDDWLTNPENFYHWALSNGYAKGLQIDRVDNDGDYSSVNCRLVSARENMRNSSATRLTKAEVLEIRALLQESVREAVIAAQFGLTQSAISRIKTRRSWSDVA